MPSSELTGPSPDQMRALLERAADGVVLIDEHGRFADANAVACEILGRSREDLLGMRVAEVVSRSEDLKSRIRVFSETGSQGGVVAIHRPDGSVRFVEYGSIAKFIPGRDLSILRDVTESRRALEQLNRSQAHLLMSQRLAHIGSWELDLDIAENINENPLRWSDELFRIFGYEPGAVQVTNDLFFSHVHPDDRLLIAEAVSKALETGGVYSIEHRIARTDLQERIVHERGEIIIDRKTGRRLKMIGTTQDITERRALELQLRQSQKMEALGRLASGVAHDFNNLLTVINGYGALLRDALRGQDAAVHTYVEEIERAGQRATALTGQLLSFSRQSVLSPRSLDLNSLLREHERMLRRLLGDRIELTMRLAEDACPVFADSEGLVQMILNLVANARDAIVGPGMVEIRTAADAAEAGGSIELTVADNGVGMTAEVQARIFEPFFTTKKHGRGTGLGLATVYGIARQSGGQVRVESEPGNGSRFRVILPRSDRPVEQASSLEDASSVPGGTETILLVEDEPEVRRFAAQVLRGYGYAVIEASGADQALRLAAAGPVHLVLTDVVMPGQTGFELAQALRTQLPGLRVLFMSGYTNRKEMYGEWVDQASLLAKPFSPVVLARRVRATLDAPASRSTARG